MIQLFTYGTLQHSDVQENIFGRILRGKPESVEGYTLQEIEIEEEFGLMKYDILVETGNHQDTISGIVYAITEVDLHQADLYEGMHYKRIEVQLSSDEKAWVYTAATS